MQKSLRLQTPYNLLECYPRVEVKPEAFWCSMRCPMSYGMLCATPQPLIGFKEQNALRQCWFGS